METVEIEPRDFDLPAAPFDSIVGGDIQRNVDIAHGILKGEGGPARDTVLANAAAALLVCRKANSLPEGVALAAEAIDSGAAMEQLQYLRSFGKGPEDILHE